MDERLKHKTNLGDADATQPGLEALLHEQGQAETDLHPGGIARIGGRRIDVVSAGELIPRGSDVRVTAVEGNRVVVEQATPSA